MEKEITSLKEEKRINTSLKEELAWWKEENTKLL